MALNSSRIKTTQTGTALPVSTQDAARNVLTQSAQNTFPAAGTLPGRNTVTNQPIAGTPAAPAPAAPPTLDQQQKDILGAGYQAPSTVDTAKGDAFTQQAIDNYKGTQDWTKNAALNAMSNSQRAAGAASQHGGLAAGGASYLTNWRQSTATGMRNLNDIMTNWQSGMGGLLTGAADNANTAAGQNAGLAGSANANNANAAGGLLGKAADADATETANKTIINIDDFEKKARWYFDGGGNGSFGEQGYNDIVTAIKMAKTDEEKAAASQRATDYVNALAQARMDYDKIKGKLLSSGKTYNDFDSYKKDNGAKYGIS